MSKDVEIKFSEELAIASLDILPNPVFVKAADLSYVWINKAFETLFSVRREDIIGDFDTNVFKNRQAVQCNGGDMRVLESGNVDEAYETIFNGNSDSRETITRKSRLTLRDGSNYLICVMHDVTDVFNANQELEKNKLLLEEQAEKLRSMANTDSLTNCINRRALFELASKELPHYKTGVSTLLLDIDFFKVINDTHGHAAGDAALKHFATVVKEQIRSTDVIARYGGEEFAVLMLDASLEEVQAVAERIRVAVEQTPLQFYGEEIKMTVSIGGARHNSEIKEAQLDVLLNEADGYLYQAKEAGRNRFLMAA